MPAQAVRSAETTRRVSLILMMIVSLLSNGAPLEARVEIKPGFNMLSPDQDIELGKEAAKDVEKQYPIVNDGPLNDYISRLGQKLARFAPGQKFPYNFHVVQNKDLNAFALPGGPVYIHSAIIAAAENESQLAGVMAHEISHVALRHSTNQASKQMLATAPLAILGGIFGSGSTAGQLAQLGIAFGANSAFLKFSRDAERQADELGAQILYDAGYEPSQMAKFFSLLEKEYGSGGSEFFASHPNPGNRQEDVTKLIPRLGPARNYSEDNTEFERMRRRALDLADQQPQPAKRPAPQPGNTSSIVPPEGIIQSGNMPAVAYGALLSTFEPYQQSGRNPTLAQATDQLIRELQRSNPNLRVTSQGRSFRHSSGQSMYSVMASGESPLKGEVETNWIVTSFRPEGLWYVVFIAPQRDFQSFQPTFQKMLDVVRFPR
jgi:predicted Zn-dependent protease